MKNPQKGFIIPLLLALIAILLAGGGIYVYENKKVEVPAVTEDINTQADISTTEAVTTAPTQSATVPAKTADEVVIHGKAAKGIILNAKIRATELVDGKMSGIAKVVEIGSSGDFSVSMPKGIILLQVITRSGSIEKDEVLKVDVPLPLGFKFRAAVDLVDVTAKSVEVNITSYSEAAVVLAEKNGGLLPKNINMANSGIANILGFDFMSTKIIESNDAVGLTNATQWEKKMTLANAAIANMASRDEMGCGAMQTYGETINCTIAKFADQFTLNTIAPRSVHLGDTGYNALIRAIDLFKASL